MNLNLNLLRGSKAERFNYLREGKRHRGGETSIGSSEADFCLPPCKEAYRIQEISSGEGLISNHSLLSAFPCPARYYYPGYHALNATLCYQKLYPAGRTALEFWHERIFPFSHVQGRLINAAEARRRGVGNQRQGITGMDTIKVGRGCRG